MGVLFKQYLAGDRIYSCSQCRTHAADHTELVSKVPQRFTHYPFDLHTHHSLPYYQTLALKFHTGIPRASRQSIPLQQCVSLAPTLNVSRENKSTTLLTTSTKIQPLQGQHHLRSSGRQSSHHRIAYCMRYSLHHLWFSPRLEIWNCLWGVAKIQRGKVYYRKGQGPQGMYALWAVILMHLYWTLCWQH